MNQSAKNNGKRIGIIGGGAAGMMAAITAARAGGRVTILESGERIGKKILSTGNGKCNLGNLSLSKEHYYGSCDFLPEVFGKFGTMDTISFFEKIGLLTKNKNGWIYPSCEQASSVLDVLRFEISSLGIKVINGFCVKEVFQRKDGTFCVRRQGGEETFDAVILAAGGKAMPKTGSDGSGYEIAKKLGHKIVPIVPALTGLKCKENFFQAIAGVRLEGMAEALDEKGGVICSDRGELQLTDYGISGIPVFQISRTVAYELKNRKEVPVRLDLLPNITSADMLQRIARVHYELRKGRTVEECLTGILPKKVMLLMIRLNGLKASEEADVLTEKKIFDILSSAKELTVNVVNTGDFQSCQVCAGGVSCREIHKNMESKLVKNLFFAGEILDVDGNCGGYNLQWAWTSGYLAGLGACGRDA